MGWMQLWLGILHLFNEALEAGSSESGQFDRQIRGFHAWY